VLFLCATNGMQSAIAEALLRRIDSEHFDAFSAGIEPGELNPLAVDALKEAGLNIDRRTPTSVRELLKREFDFVITLCERAEANCPDFPNAERIHWHFEDPLASTDIERQRRAFRALRDQIAQRLHLFVLVQVRSKSVVRVQRVQSERPAAQSA
jgi:protein-tyrosine-phosphatase